MLENDLSQFTVKSGATPVVCPCVGLTLYLDATDDDGLLDFHDRALEALRGQLTHVIADNAARRAAITPRSLELVQTWVAKPRQNKRYFIEYFGLAEGASGAKLGMNFEPRPAAAFTPAKREMRRSNWRNLDRQSPGGIGLGLSQLYVSFPPGHSLAQPAALLRWIQSLRVVSQGPLVSGHCGLALNDYRETADAAMADALQSGLSSLLLRYPGFDWDPHVAARLMVFRRGDDDLVPLIKRVNWLTFAGQRAVESLGGLAAVEARFARTPDVQVKPFPWGALVQAGAAPQTGDVGQRNFIPAYRAAASALRPIRLTRLDAGVGRGFTPEAANEWLESLDRDYGERSA